MEKVFPVKKAFVSYASVDKDMVDRLRTHLAELKREKKLEIWYAPEILVGEEWNRRIHEKLDSSDMVILCVSPDFLDSEYVQNVEVRKALDRHDAGECIVIPVILKPCDWRNHPFARLQVTPEGGTPVTEHNNPDKAWAEVAKAIRKTIEAMPYHTEPSLSATPGDAQPNRPQQVQINHEVDKSFKHTLATVYSAKAGLAVAEADILALFPNSTWQRATTDARGQAYLRLHSSHLPMTVFAAAPGYAACIEHDWVPAKQVLPLRMIPLPGGGSVIFPEAGGALPGLGGQLEPVRDWLDRTYLHTKKIAVNDGQPQPVFFEFGEELRLTDADGNERWVRIIDIAGHSALVEYRARPSSAAEK